MESSGERMSAGNKYVEWGFGNQYPAYLRDLYLDVATLETIINGTVDYVLGNSITCNVERFAESINGAGDTLAELVERLATDYLIYGGFAFAVIRALDGSVGQLEYQDLETVRSNEDNTIFYVAQSWRKGTRVKAIELPKFGAKDSNPRSLVYVKGSKTRGVYPIPVWNVKAAEIERKIGDFHLSNLDNGFAAARIFKFHSGVPDDNTKAEIERGIDTRDTGTHYHYIKSAEFQSHQPFFRSKSVFYMHRTCICTEDAASFQPECSQKSLNSCCSSVGSGSKSEMEA